MRLPYIPLDPHFSDPEDEAIVDRVRQRRGSAGLLELDRTLLHAPHVADGWNSFLGAIRTRTSLPTSIRELAISRVAVLNGAWYEWGHHAPLLLASPNMTEAHVEAVRSAALHDVESFSNVFDERHTAVFAYVDAMTKDVQVPDDVFARLKALFSDKEVVEITATVAAYNCVSRFLVALDVGEKNGEQPSR